MALLRDRDEGRMAPGGGTPGDDGKPTSPPWPCCCCCCSSDMGAPVLTELSGLSAASGLLTRRGMLVSSREGRQGPSPTGARLSLRSASGARRDSAIPPSLAGIPSLVPAPRFHSESFSATRSLPTA